jgi:hypothetical protein
MAPPVQWCTELARNVSEELLKFAFENKNSWEAFNVKTFS